MEKDAPTPDSQKGKKADESRNQENLKNFKKGN